MIDDSPTGAGTEVSSDLWETGERRYNRITPARYPGSQVSPETGGVRPAASPSESGGRPSLGIRCSTIVDSPLRGATPHQHSSVERSVIDVRREALSGFHPAPAQQRDQEKHRREKGSPVGLPDSDSIAIRINTADSNSTTTATAPLSSVDRLVIDVRGEALSGFQVGTQRWRPGDAFPRTL